MSQALPRSGSWLGQGCLLGVHPGCSEVVPALGWGQEGLYLLRLGTRGRGERI